MAGARKAGTMARGTPTRGCNDSFDHARTGRFTVSGKCQAIAAAIALRS